MELLLSHEIRYFLNFGCKFELRSIHEGFVRANLGKNENKVVIQKPTHKTNPSYLVESDKQNGTPTWILT